MGFDWLATLVVHASAAIGLLAVTATLIGMLRPRQKYKRVSSQVMVFAGLLLGQGAVGIVQSIIVHPEALIVAHMLMSTLILAGSIRIFLTAHMNLTGKLETDRR